MNEHIIIKDDKGKKHTFYNLKELINYLGLDKFQEFNIPEFLFLLTYHKCFSDVSLLTRAECSNLRGNFERIYMNILKQYDVDIDESDTINMVDFLCDAIKLDDQNIVCNVTYPKAGQIAKIRVEIDKKYNELVLKALTDPKAKETLKPIVQIEIQKKKFIE